MWEGVQKESNIQNTISLVMGGERCEGGGRKAFHMVAGLENHKADDEHVCMPPTATSSFIVCTNTGFYRYSDSLLYTS